MEDVGFYLYAPLTRQMSNEGLLNESDSEFVLNLSVSSRTFCQSCQHSGKI